VVVERWWSLGDVVMGMWGSGVWGWGGVAGTSSLSGEGDGRAIVVVGGDTEGAGVMKVATGCCGWVVCRGDVSVLVAH
jgi:hypothetical protein